MRVLLLLIIFTSCGKIPSDIIKNYSKPKVNITDPVFDSYIRQFEVEYGNKIKTPIVYSKNMRLTTVGVCSIWYNGDKIIYKEITINKDHWDKKPYKYNASEQEINDLLELKRQQIIDHELGHCELNRDHNNDILDSGHKASIMHPFIFGTLDLEYLENNTTYYLNELFGR